MVRVVQSLSPAILRHFHHTRQKPHNLWLPFTISSLSPATTDQLSVSGFALLWTFRTKGIRQYMVLGDCLLSVSIRFSRYFHAIACICISFLLWAPLCGIRHYVDRFKWTFFRKSFLAPVLAPPHLVLSALTHSVNRDSLVIGL